LAVKLFSKGPVLYRQTRAGKYGAPFTLYKFRSMYTDAEIATGAVWATKDDPRITPIGRWLRKLRLDEMPQLFNVIRGDMSLVGPRPMVPEMTLEFQQAYTELLMVRPGLTDPATLKYCREDELLSHVPDQMDYYKEVLMPDKLALSTAYLDRATVWTDFGILGRTAFALVPHTWMPRAIRNARAARRHIGSERLFVEAAESGETDAAAENRVELTA
jgi:lipopolysaccharide/colanic/teichoic acid biosynthesis glycosyltransferase